MGNLGEWHEGPTGAVRSRPHDDGLRAEAQANATLRWAVVRDPIQKLESGVRQIWERPGWNRFLSADELLRKQLALNVGKFVDEHFEPNAWRLSGRLKDGRALRLDYVVKLEELDAAWPELAALLVRGARGSRQKTLATFAAPFTESDRRNHHAAINARTHKSSRLSPAMVAAAVRLAALRRRVGVLRLSAAGGMWERQ